MDSKEEKLIAEEYFRDTATIDELEALVDKESTIEELMALRADSASVSD